MKKNRNTDRKAYGRAYYLAHRDEIIARTTAYQKEHREAFREYQKEWESEHRRTTTGDRHLETCAKRRSRYLSKDPLDFMRRRLFSFAKCRAKKLGIPFNLSVDDINIPDVCPVFGTPFSVEIGKRSDWAPSLDRLIPKLGYIKGNVSVISWRANRIKGDATLEELKMLVDFLEKSNNKVQFQIRRNSSSGGCRDLPAVPSHPLGNRGSVTLPN